LAGVQLIDGVPVFSATDLVGYLACEHLTNLERAALAGLVKRPVRPDPELDLVAQRGLEHEQRFLQSLRDDGLTVSEIVLEEWSSDARSGLNSALDATRTAMQRGDEVIYQATLFDGRWRGHADFLRRVDNPSALGAHSYEVWDTKLARHTKGSAILQLCLYSDLLAGLQGWTPEFMHVALGGSTATVEHHRVADYGAYYRLVRSVFDAFVADSEATYPPSTRPDPVEHCDVCRWNLECTSVRRRTDDLSLVAGITSRQRRALRTQGVDTRGALAALPLPIEAPPEGTTRESLTRVREQARIQVAGDTARPKVLYELVEPARTRAGELEPNRGLLVLPEPSPGDLFLDLEGDPYAFGDGIDYLFGVIEPAVRDAEGQAAYRGFWSRDKAGDVSLAGEKAAFEACIDFITARIERDPHMHVFHYAPYEATALGRLMGRHATREDEVDRVLRGGFLIDLFRAVRQGVRASVESYSIKRLEHLYGFERTVDLRDAGSSIVAFETWLQLGEGPATASEILARIQGYNRDDCISNLLLRDWLEGRRVELGDRLKVVLPRPAIESAEPKEDVAGTMDRINALGRRLTEGVPAAISERTPDQQASWLTAQLLSWHRREEKSTWWRYFYLMDDLTDEERVDEPDALGLLTYEGATETAARSIVHRYRFPPQEHAIEVGTDVRDPATKERSGAVVAIDNVAGTVDVRRAKTSSAPHPTSLVPLEYVSTGEQRASLERIGAWVADHGIDSAGRYRAARDLLLRRPPRQSEPRAATSAAPSEFSRTVCERALALDHSYLAIQGPPGSGKTTIGAEIVVDFVISGLRVGVTANSHKVIGNLLDKVAVAAKKRGARVRIAQKPASGEKCTCVEATQLDTNSLVRQSIEAGEIDVVGATTWTWARDEMTEHLDYLLVDEAGQMSLANVVAASSTAHNVILLGDPQQLDQPLQGSHPPGAGRSAMAHLLDGQPTMPSELGVLLEETWRLHPDICAYTSEVFYEGRLKPARGTETQHVDVPGWHVGHGLRYVKVEHFGNHNESEEEAAAVSRLVSDLITAPAAWTDANALSHPLYKDDVLILTPYNAQVGALGRTVAGARVGTVDKFQGQEAPVAVYSMATSSAEDAPRGMEFLYSLHRLNVATSRARCLAVIVASPELIRVRCRTPRQMQLANALARFVEIAMAAGSGLTSETDFTGPFSAAT
jgi:predicted RecB family nuclease